MNSIKSLFTLMLTLFCAACAPGNMASTLPSSLVNGGFDSASGGLPAGWQLDQQVRDKGQAHLLDSYSSATGKVLELQPNPHNTGDKLLGVGQLLDASSLRGQRLSIDVSLGASGRATAIVGVHALGKGGDLGFVQISQGDSGGALKSQHRILDIPDAAQNLVVYAIVSGTSGKALFDRVNVSVATTAIPMAAVGGAASAILTIDTGRVVRQIPATLYGTNVEWIFDGQGMWSTTKGGLDPDAVQLSRKLGPTLIRFPGGVFSDYYHWRDGLGPQSQRPTTENTPKGPKSRHSVGTQEISEFAHDIGAELLLTVNAGTGTVAEAADWVRYMNRGIGPKVHYWEVGNELYMKDDMSGAHLSPEDYATRFVNFADAMRAVDPDIKIGAIGGLNYGQYRFISDDRWTEVLLRRAAGKMDFLAVHNAYAPVVIGVNKSVNPRSVYSAMLAAPVQIEQNLQDVSSLLAKHEKPGHPIAIAVTEWGPFFHVSPDSPWVDHIKTMGSALFMASTLNALLRTPRVDIATFFKLTDQGFMGWVGRRKGEWVPTAPYMAFSLYRHNLGRNLVDAKVAGPTYNSPGIGVVSAMDKVPYLDTVATLDKDKLTVLVVNKSEKAVEGKLSLKGVTNYGGVKVEVVYADSLDANTGTDLPNIPGLKWAKQVDLGRFAKGGPGEIHTSNDTLPAAVKPGADQTLDYSFRPLSVTSLTFTKVMR